MLDDGEIEFGWNSARAVEIVSMLIDHYRATRERAA
jgi:hypothetical protein